MFRIDLIKISVIFLYWAPTISWAEELEKRILDTKGNPIPNAIIQVEGFKPILVNSQGEFTEKVPTGKYVLIFALGFDSLQMSWKEWTLASEIILKERQRDLEEVTITATRTDRSVANLPLPVSVLNADQVLETGSLRLSEILREQTGLQITSDHGTALQLQGLDSDYILILLDGEPLIGRTAGTFDLDRLSVSNIERIEILRGPSSAIYGSEAMAGVINIITKIVKDTKNIELGLRNRSFNSWNPFVDLGYKTKNWKISGFYDFLRSDGFDLTPETIGQTQNPFDSQTAQLKITREFSPKWEVSLFSRGYLESSNGEMESGNLPNTLLNTENSRRDLNLNPIIRFKPSADLLVTLRGMNSWFDTQSDTRTSVDGSWFDFQEFHQFYNRTEVQTDYQIDSKNLISIGLGHLIETVEATRYEDLNRFETSYLFLQHQWDPNPRTSIIGGLRGDLHNQFGSRMSPKIAGQFKFTETFSWQASIGAGFKTPDFRQLLLNFNNASSGYYVFGANLAAKGIETLKKQGLVAQVLLQPETLGNLQAENSWAVNTGFRWKPITSAALSINGYRNQIDNLIETAPIAKLITGQNAFSYFNVRSVITQGIEADFSWEISPKLRISAGYAFLDTRDVQVLERIDAGELFKRNSQNTTTRVSRSDYGGLFNRIRHSSNIKINYTETITGTDWSLRAIYRGRLGFADLNGNLILDDKTEYAPTWISLNLTVSKTLQNGIFFEAGGTNLLNVSTPSQPNNPGRVLFLGTKVHLKKLFKQ